MIEKILQRTPYSQLTEYRLETSKKILVTGGRGSIGTRLSERLPNATITDIGDLDVTKESVIPYVKEFNPEVIINIAGAKHAPLGEEDIAETIRVNTLGVINLLSAKGNAKLIQCSTCKSANPETVYGSTKLISERLVLNAGGVVARFFNVVETSGNVFEIWKDKDPIDVAINCKRHFISLDEAVGLLLRCVDLKTGRYIINAPKLIEMMDVANAIYPNRTKRIITPRRGDRLIEVFLASNEKIVEELFNGAILRVESTHDPKRAI